MKLIKQIFLIGFFLVFCLFNVTFAETDEPIISYNVQVAPQGNPPQCPSSWKGNMYPDAEQVLSGAGIEQTQTGPIIRSCTDCLPDPKTKNCVCAKCYDYYN